jgi:hypothetical protein
MLKKCTFIFLLFAFLKVFPQKIDINEGLQAYWDFQTYNGGMDSLFKGTPKNALLSQSDLHNRALSLEGENSYIAISNGINFFNHFTIAFWLKGNDFSKEQVILNQQGKNNKNFQLKLLNKELNFDCSDEYGSSNSISTQLELDVNKWYFVTLVCYNSTFTIYLNSLKIIETDNFDLNIREKQEKDSLFIGALQEGHFSFNGLLDELMIYNRAINEEEIKYLFNNHFPNPLAKPIVASAINNRIPVILDSMISKNKTLNIIYFDDGLVDKDTISIYFNGKKIVDKEGLTNKSKTVKVELIPYQNNYISLFAENLGDIPPNTAKVIVYVNNVKHELTVSSDFINNGTLQFYYNPDNK